MKVAPMFGKLTSLQQRIITGAGIGLVFVGVFFLLPTFMFTLLLTIIFSVIAWYEWPPLFYWNNQFKQKLFWLITPVYLLLPFFCLTLMNYSNYRPLLIVLFLLVFVFDMAAYFTGTFLGKHKIAPTISPKKTWEGVLGGYLAIYAAVVCWLIWQGKDLNADYILILCAFVAVLATLGDLFESWLKRKAAVKDSGTFLPGHGGLLDRFDALMFIAPVFYVCRVFLMHFFF